MFQFRRFPSHTYLFQYGIPCGGFPHSEISGSQLICSSPKLIAAYHVLHRLLMPRHSPCALSSLTFVEAIEQIPSITHRLRLWLIDSLAPLLLLLKFKPASLGFEFVRETIDLWAFASLLILSQSDRTSILFSKQLNYAGSCFGSFYAKIVFYPKNFSFTVAFS